MSWLQEDLQWAPFSRIGHQCRMRHRKHGRRFSRTSSHRIAMMRNLAASLIEHEVIKTTVEKGKELEDLLSHLLLEQKLILSTIGDRSFQH